jgi:hypothetical protein
MNVFALAKMLIEQIKREVVLDDEEFERLQDFEELIKVLLPYSW